MRHANNGFVTEDIKAHKKTVYEKTHRELKSLGFTSNEIELIQKKKFLNTYVNTKKYFIVTLRQEQK